MSTTGRRVVYTALLGGYEVLVEQPVAHDSDLEFVCLTDDPALRSDTWSVQVIEPAFPHDIVRSARMAKLRPDEHLPGVAESLWIDNCVLLHRPPDALVSAWLDAADMGVPYHSFRDTVLDEFTAVATLGLDDHSRVYEQLVHYAAEDPQGLAERPHWTGMLARRRTPEVIAAERMWADHVLRYSRRDQLSLTHVLRTRGLQVAGITLDNNSSDFHQWPHHVQRLPGHARRAWGAAMMSPLGEVNALSRRAEDLERRLAAVPRAAQGLFGRLQERSDRRRARGSASRHPSRLPPPPAPPPPATPPSTAPGD